VKQLHLLIDRDVAIGFMRPIEPAEPASAERRCVEMARRDFIALGKFP